MPELADWEQLDRYFAGELGEDDAVLLRRWLMAHPEHARLLNRVNQELDYASPLGDLDRSDALASWHALTARMQGDTHTPAVTEVTDLAVGRLSLRGGVSPREKSAHPALRGIGGVGTHPLRRGIWTSVAALVVGVVIAAIGWNAAMRHSGASVATSMSVYTTGKGQRATITLPDGNTVALNVASHLEVPADFMAGDHTVRLVGEGLFDITNRERTPFTVISGSATTRVLGTRFVVRHYTSDSTTLVAVQTGRVAVRSVVLTAAQQLEISRAGITNVQVANPALYSFSTGVLMLNGTRLSDAIPDLNRWYDADIRLGDSVVASRRITAGLPAGSLSDLSDDLEYMLNVHVLRNGRVLTLMQR